jgi:plasmid stabilization system protein ParE
MALADRDAIMEHLAEDNWAAAIRLDEDFGAHADRACQAPALYRSGRMKEKREIVVHPNSVMVYQAACGDAFEGADRAAGIETVVTSLIGPTGDDGVGVFASEGIFSGAVFAHAEAWTL